MNEQKRDEEDLVLHYQAVFQQYDEIDDNDTTAGLFNECNQLYSILQKQREINEKAAQTIFDNYCVFSILFSSLENRI